MPNLEAIEVYNALKERLGEEPTRALLKYIEEATRANVATKEDLLALKEDLLLTREALEKKVGELDLKIERVKVELMEEITKTRLYVVIAAVIIVLTNPKILELLGKAITLFR
jgi:hypothetical protein